MRAVAVLAFSAVATSAFGCAGAPIATRTLSTEPARVTAAVRVQSAPAPKPATTAGPAGDATPSALGVASTEVASTEIASTELTSSEARCPAEMALVADRVCVDRWEAIVVEVIDGEERVWSPYEPLDDHDGGFHAVSRPDVVPQGYVSGAIAERACRASGKRLCSADEWVTACRGPSRSRFPYGNERRAGACNDDVRPVHPVVEAAKRRGLPAGQTWREGMNLPEINQLPDSLAHTGERAACTTEEGVHDMVGNLHEWTSDPEGTFRGGFYMDTTQNGDGCDYQTTAHDFEYHDYSTGFRCCLDPYDIE